jgi:hypothetical protein
MPTKRVPLSKGYNLSACYPEIAAQWDYAANSPHRPEHFTPGSGKRFFWICTVNPEHRWTATICTRSAGHGCSACAGKTASKDNSIGGTYPELSAEWHSTKNGSLTPDDILCGSRKKRHWICHLGHEWMAMPLNRTSGGSGCPTCANSGTSRIEIRVFSEIYSVLSSEADVDWRQQVSGQECDIALLEFNLAIEIDGHYWHDGKEAKDMAKRQTLEAAGIRLIRLRDDRLGFLGHRDDVLFSAREGDDQIMARLASRLSEICREEGLSKPAELLSAYARMGVLLDEALYENMVRNMGRPPAGKSFADVSPNAALDWDSEKNGTHGPDDYFPHSHCPAHWKCPTCSYRWRVSIGSRTAGNGCPGCAGRVATRTNNLALASPEMLSEWDYERNDMSPSEVLPNSTLVTHWKCPRGHLTQASVLSRVRIGCRLCNREDGSLATQNPEIATQWHPTKNGDITPDDVSYGSKSLSWWTCDAGHEWEATVNGRTSGNGCPVCSGHLVILETSLAHLHPELAKQWVSSEQPGLTPETVRPGSNKSAKWKCARGHIWQATITSRASAGNGCPTCQDPLADVDYKTLPKSFSEARRIGAKYYFTGKPCQRHGHIAPRHAGNKNCRECSRTRSSEYHARKSGKA